MVIYIRACNVRSRLEEKYGTVTLQIYAEFVIREHAGYEGCSAPGSNKKVAKKLTSLEMCQIQDFEVSKREKGRSKQCNAHQ